MSIMEETEHPFVMGNHKCSLCPNLEHTSCMGCQTVFCRTHAISALSWTPIGKDFAPVSLVLCGRCLPLTISILNKAQAHLQLLAQYEP